MPQTIITLQYGDFPVLFQENAFINATKIAKQFNKHVRDYFVHENTINYLESLKRYAVKDQSQLVLVTKEGLSQEQGMWLHPYLGVDFARWLAADFAVWCEKQIEYMLHPAKTHSKAESYQGMIARSMTSSSTEEVIIVTPDRVEQKIPDGMVIIAAKRYQQLQKIAGLTTFDHIKEIVEENGGKVLLKSDFEKIKGLLDI
ncbi:MAG: hypothetical protein QG557_939 [Pseudomonadota bacterium]|jgi:hypothetical protein|nr:hypothetical protein [Pseudomonadota bacterium]